MASSSRAASFNNNKGETVAIVDPTSYDDLLAVSQRVRELAGTKAEVTVGIICGSGLGDLAEQVEDQLVIPYNQIPGFPNTHVAGHKGNLVFGRLAGKGVVCLQGRFHPYEHAMNLALCAFPVRVMHQLGVKTLIVSNAAGGINAKFQFGDLVLLKDQIFLPGLIGYSPFVGLNDPRFGARFVSVHDAYDKKLRLLAQSIGQEQGIRLHEGVYMMTGGPQYETPAEVSFAKIAGADCLGMSTCHEVVVARQCGLRVVGFSLITNIANTDADTSVPVSHEEVLHEARQASTRACAFVREIVGRMDSL